MNFFEQPHDVDVSADCEQTVLVWENPWRVSCPSVGRSACHSSSSRNVQPHQLMRVKTKHRRSWLRSVCERATATVFMMSYQTRATVWETRRKVSPASSVLLCSSSWDLLSHRRFSISSQSFQRWQFYRTTQTDQTPERAAKRESATAADF